MLSVKWLFLGGAFTMGGDGGMFTSEVNVNPYAADNMTLKEHELTIYLGCPAEGTACVKQSEMTVSRTVIKLSVKM